MTKAVSIISGLILIGLGVWGAMAWSGAVLMFVKAVLVIAALFTGLVLIVFILSELRAPEPPASPSAPVNPRD